MLLQKISQLQKNCAVKMKMHVDASLWLILKNMGCWHVVFLNWGGQCCTSHVTSVRSLDTTTRAVLPREGDGHDFFLSCEKFFRAIDTASRHDLTHSKKMI